MQGEVLNGHDPVKYRFRINPLLFDRIAHKIREGRPVFSIPARHQETTILNLDD